MAQVGHFYTPTGLSAFRVFAPSALGVVVLLAHSGERLALARDGIGHWFAEHRRLPPGTMYWLELDGRRLPDPASRYQPQGVHGPSMVVELAPATSPGWTGVRMEDAIIYELHLGTFTPEGTLAAAQQRLPQLAELGLNVVELLPIAAFPGERNWGYDGTFLFALHPAYGSWSDL